MSRFITDPAIVIKITSFVPGIIVELTNLPAYVFIHR